MKRLVIPIVVCLSWFPAFLWGQDCGNPQNVYSFMFQGKKYEIVKELYSWAIAAQCATDRGGYLVQINSRAEQDTVYRSIVNGAKIPVNYKTVLDGGGVAYLWIGATDKGTEGTWLWDGNNDGIGTHFWTGQGSAGNGSGTAVGNNYNNWGGASVNPNNSSRRNEPDDYAGAQDGAAIALSGWPGGSGALGIAGEWNDISTTNQIYFIIEYDSTSSTHPDELRTQVTVFPNPAVNEISITSAGSMNPVTGIKIYNLLGSLVYVKTNIRTNNYKIELPDFQSGAYFIHINLDNGESVVRKVMVR
jgi:hypothetical protein